MRLGATLVLGLLAAGCVQTQEMALSQNVYQLQVSGSGLIAASQVPGSTQVKAAELTLAKGYTHFILDNASLQSGSRIVGTTPVYGSVGPYGAVNLYGGQPVRAPTSSASVTVRMFTAKDRPANALDARAVIAANKA